MKPHSWRPGDVLHTIHGLVGVVTETTVYGVTIGRCFHSQTLIKEQVHGKEAEQIRKKSRGRSPEAEQLSLFNDA